jgi:hypothetical protein
MAAAGGAPKSSLALFRDCLRLVKHVAGTGSPKAAALRRIVAAQFREHAREADPARLHALKSSAERGLSNYLIFSNARTDPKVAAHAAEVGVYEDDADGNLVRVREASAATPLPQGVRLSREMQARGELPPGAAGAAAAAAAGARRPVVGAGGAGGASASARRPR